MDHNRADQRCNELEIDAGFVLKKVSKDIRGVLKQKFEFLHPQNHKLQKSDAEFLNHPFVLDEVENVHQKEIDKL